MKANKGKTGKAQGGGKFKKTLEEEEEIQLTIEEDIRTLEEIDEDEGEAMEDVNEKKGVDIFEKCKESEVQAKLKLVRELQASLQRNRKWMWPLGSKMAISAFVKPKRSLEQYVTPLPDALAVGHIIQAYIEGKTVADLGAGTGMLGITCLLAGAE